MFLRLPLEKVLFDTRFSRVFFAVRKIAPSISICKVNLTLIGSDLQCSY